MLNSFLAPMQSINRLSLANWPKGFTERFCWCLELCFILRSVGFRHFYCLCGKLHCWIVLRFHLWSGIRVWCLGHSFLILLIEFLLFFGSYLANILTRDFREERASCSRKCRRSGLRKWLVKDSSLLKFDHSKLVRRLKKLHLKQGKRRCNNGGGPVGKNLE